jgi:hypothetical protein
MLVVSERERFRLLKENAELRLKGLVTREACTKTGRHR